MNELEEMLKRAAGAGEIGVTDSTSIRVNGVGTGNGQGEGSMDASRRTSETIGGSAGPGPGTYRVNSSGDTSVLPGPSPASNQSNSNGSFPFTSSTAFSFPGPSQGDPHQFIFASHHSDSAMADSVTFHGSAGTPSAYALGTTMSTTLPVNPGALSQATRPAEQAFDFSTLDPSFMNLVSQFQATSTGQDQGHGQGQGQSVGAGAGVGMGMGMGDQIGQMSGMDGLDGLNLPSPNTLLMLNTPSLMSAFTNANSFFDSTPLPGQSNIKANQAPSTAQSLFPPSQFQSRTSNTSAAPGITDFPQQSSNNGNRYPAASVADEQSTSNGQGHFPGQDLVDDFSSWKRNPETDGLPLVGGWFDAADLPRVARDHL